MLLRSGEWLLLQLGSLHNEKKATSSYLKVGVFRKDVSMIPSGNIALENLRQQLSREVDGGLAERTVGNAMAARYTC